MIGIRKLSNAPVIHFETAGDFRWADLESARLTIQLLVIQYGSVCVLESCDVECRIDDEEQDCMGTLLWDQIAEYFTSEEVPAVNIVCDMDSMDVFSGTLSSEDSRTVNFFPADQFEDAMQHVIRFARVSSNHRSLKPSRTTSHRVGS